MASWRLIIAGIWVTSGYAYNIKDKNIGGKKIDAMKSGSTRNIRPTHFISVPVQPNYQLRQFLEYCRNIGIRQMALLPPTALHLTLEIFSTEEKQHKIEEVKSVLSSINFNSFQIDLKGLYLLKGNMNEARVLVTKPVENDLLSGLMDEIRAKYLKQNLITEDSTPKIAHVTLANVKYTRDRNYRFNANDLFVRFGNEHNFGSIQVEQIQLCKMGMVNGKYKSIMNVSEVAGTKTEVSALSIGNEPLLASSAEVLTQEVPQPTTDGK